MKIQYLSIPAIVLVLMSFSTVLAQSDPRVYTIGNLGDLSLGSSELDQFDRWMGEQEERSIFILNGDLITRKNGGLIHPNDTLRLFRWLSMFSKHKHAEVIILPGDRDWQSSGPLGWKMVQQLEETVLRWGFPRVSWPVTHGCPGPVVMDMGQTLRLVFIQTQWWNHPYDRPSAVDVACDIITERDFFDEVEDILREAYDKNLIVVGHYPLLSFDPYGGRMSWKQHIFPLTDVKEDMYVPLPVVGSMYAALRQNVGKPKDIENGRFNGFRTDLLDQIRQNGQVLYLAGHGHNMQLIQLEDNYILNAGSIGQAGFVGKDRRLRYRASAKGFAGLQFKENGDVFARYYHYKPKLGYYEADATFLFQSACDPGRNVPEETPYNQTFGFCGDEPFGSEAGFRYYDSVAYVQAGSQYKAGGLKRFLLGKHYRKAWTTPTAITYLNMDTTYGGLELTKVGGGFQTRSLRLRAPTGNAYSFLSIDKDISRIVNYDLRQTLVATFLKDHTSTLHPYGAMVTDTLMDALGILHPSPHPWLMPPDARLGPYAGQYAHLLGMLELYPKGKQKGVTGFAGSDKVLSSFAMLGERYKQLQRSPDERAYATARLFDLWVGDWDRHDDNWKWAYYKKENKTLPVPRDRDQVFSRWDGFFPSIIDWRFVRPEIEGFENKKPDILGLSFTGRHLDRFLLNQLDKDDWQSLAKSFQHTIDSSLIRSAIQVLPVEVRSADSAFLAHNLHKRLNELPLYVKKLSRILDRKVDVVGDNGENRFVVTRMPTGEVEVKIFDEGEQVPSWRRLFNPDDTREIRLFGLSGNDRFEVGSNSLRVKAPIRIRLVGGLGADTIIERSELIPFAKNTAIYEKDAGSVYKLSRAAQFRSPPSVEPYHYNRLSHEPNMWSPARLIGYNRDDFFLVSMGAKYKVQGYGKTPYASKHIVRLTTATNSRAWGINYEGIFRHVMHKWDLSLDVIFDRPSRYVYFFGFGNNSTKNDSLFEADFYRTRYNSQRYRIGLMRQFANRSKVHISLAYEDNEPQLDSAGVMGLPDNQQLIGRDQANFIRIQGELDLDFRDNKGLPRNGTRLLASETIGFVMNERDRPYGIFRLEGEAYATIRGRTPITLGLGGGGGTTFGPVPFYHLFYLGHGNNLRGYFRNRFTGSGVMFANSELRWEAFRLRGLSSPLSAGIKVFSDVGRVFRRGEESQRWHLGYGFGIFVVPYKENFTLSATLGYSVEESNFIRFGFGVPFR
jgi:hypothetical protein